MYAVGNRIFGVKTQNIETESIFGIQLAFPRCNAFLVRPSSDLTISFDLANHI